MPQDLTHIQRQIQKNKLDAADFRKQAQAERVRAQQKRDQGEDTGAIYHDQSAEQLEDKSEQLEREAEELTSEKSNQEARLSMLQKQRDDLENKHNSDLKALDREIEQVRGSQLSL